MIEIYHGDGKGKTTAAVGLAVRAAGNGIPVLFVQFLKDDTSGEIAMLQKLGIETLHAPENLGFVSRMRTEEREKTKAYCMDMLEYAGNWMAKRKSRGACVQTGDSVRAVVVLDEILHALKYGLLDETSVAAVSDMYRADIELVLTGRNPSEALLAHADYVTEMKKEKHPYEQGISARKGIEF